MLLEETWLDLKYSIRGLSKSPGFAAVAIGVLALGIGVNAAMFGALNMLLLRPTGVTDPDQLVSLHNESVDRPGTYRAFSYPAFAALRDRSVGFSQLAAHDISVVGLTDDDVTTRSMAGLVSENYFTLFGETLDQGRPFTLEEARPGAGIPVTIVSHGFWKRRGAPSDFVGSNLEVNGHSVTVVGIASAGFAGSTAIFSPDLWLPLGFYKATLSGPMAGRSGELEDPGNEALMIIGRLASGRDPESVKPELDVHSAALAQSFPSVNGPRRVTVSTLSRMSMSTDPGNDRALFAPAFVLMAMTALVLLIACLNLANMFLARGASRQAEMAVRASLGGGRVRLLRQVLIECLLLSVLGGLVGLGLAYASSRLLLSTIGGLLPFGMTLQLDVSPDLRVIVVTALFSVAATLLFGLGPALKVTRGDLVGSLKTSLGETGNLHSGWRRSATPRNLLIVAQISLSLALLTAGGLFVRGALQAADATPGFELEGGILVELDPSLLGYSEERTLDVYRQVLARLRSVAGVETVGFASLVPFGSVSSSRRVSPAGQQLEPEDTPSALNYVVGSDYFEAVGLPILRGRGFTELETFSKSEDLVAIIDQPLARRLWPESEALGRFIEVKSQAADSAPRPLQIVGIVPGVRHNFFATAPEAHLYIPYGQQPTANMHLHVRAAGANQASLVLQTLREEIRGVDANVPVVNLKTLVDHRDQSLFVWLVRAGAKVFSALGLVAVLMALVGIYGVHSFLMARRTREIGLRLALGATPALVVGSLVREGLRLTLVGLAIGVVLAIGVARLVSSMLYGVSAADPVVLLMSTLVLGVAATLATYLPARRTTKIDPTTALRQI